MGELFGRKIEIVTDKKKFNGDELTISFDVPFDDDSEPNIATIDIFNLSDKTVNELKKGVKVTINAGYQNDVGSIFTGTLQIPTTTWQGVDRTTKLECMDSGEKWFKEKITKTYKAGITGQQILKDLLPKTGLVVGALKLPVNKVYKSGKSVKSTLAEAIYEVAKDCGAKMQINKGKIFIRAKGEGDDIRFVLDAGHGLIGSPTPIEQEEKYTVIEKVKVTKKSKKKTVVQTKDKKVEKTRVRKGWKVVSLLNNRITTDTIIQIKSRTANGMFRVEKGRHKGGSNGDQFYTEMEVFPK